MARGRTQDTSPHSIDAEQAVLGAVLVGNKWPIVASILNKNDFYRDAHQKIFVAMARLSERGVAQDPVTLCHELGGDLESCGGAAYISRLIDGVPKSSNLEAYAGIVREKSRLRWLSALAVDMRTQALSEFASSSEICDAVVSQMLSLAPDRGRRAYTLKEVLADYRAAMERELGEPMMSGYADVDAIVGGFYPSQMVIVAARPSVGKTSFALGIAQRVAEGGKRVVYFNPDGTSRALMERMLTWSGHASARAFFRGEVDAAQFAGMQEAMTRLEELPIQIEEESRTVTEMYAWCKRIEAERGSIDAVIVDHLQMLSGHERRQSRSDEVGDISRKLKRLAKDLGTVVVALSQLSRAPESRRDKRPQLSDLRESGALEQDADVVLCLYRAEMHKPSPDNRGIAEAIVAKNKDGPVGVAKLYFSAELSQFGNLAF